jgi:hypothetical protein
MIFKEAVTLLDDPMHDAVEVFNTIALQLKTQSKAVIKRRIKALALFVGGALIASSLWLMGTATIFTQCWKQTLTIPAEPGAIAPARPRQTVAVQEPANPAAVNTVSQAAQAESDNMQNIMKESHESLPASLLKHADSSNTGNVHHASKNRSDGTVSPTEDGSHTEAQYRSRSVHHPALNRA